MRKQSSSTVKVASGPPSGTTYRDNNQYTGGELSSDASIIPSNGFRY